MALITGSGRRRVLRRQGSLDEGRDLVAAQASSIGAGQPANDRGEAPQLEADLLDVADVQDAQRQREYEEKLAYERQSQLQHAKVQQEIQEQHMYEQWRRDRTDHGDSLSSDEVSRAQRLLRGLGYYNGQVDGIVGSGTTSAVKAYQRDNGMAVTGQITPALISSMQAKM